MSNWKKTLEKVMSGQADQNIDFEDACTLLRRFGYYLDRQSGSHRIFKKAGQPAINIQPRKGKAKHYQVAQMREVLKNQQIQ